MPSIHLNISIIALITHAHNAIFYYLQFSFYIISLIFFFHCFLFTVYTYIYVRALFTNNHWLFHKSLRILCIWLQPFSMSIQFIYAGLLYFSQSVHFLSYSLPMSSHLLLLKILIHFGFVFFWLNAYIAAQYSWHDGRRKCYSSSSRDSSIKLWRKKVFVSRGTGWCCWYKKVRVIYVRQWWLMYVTISFKWKCHLCFAIIHI